MKHLLKQYLDQGLSQRQLVSGLSAFGTSTVGAKAVAQNLSPLRQAAEQGASAVARLGRSGIAAVEGPYPIVAIGIEMRRNMGMKWPQSAARMTRRRGTSS